MLQPSQERSCKWLALDRDRRRRVARAVRKGRPVEDPRDAPYAVGFADATLEWLSWGRRFLPVHLLLALVLLAELLFTASWRPAAVLYPLLLFGAMRLLVPARRRRALAAREANSRLVDDLELQPVAIEMPLRSLFRPRTRLRRLFVGVVTILLGALVTLAVFVGIDASRRNHRWAAAATRICVRAHARADGVRRSGLGALEIRRRVNVIEETSVNALERLRPADEQSPLQKRFLDWKRYQLELDLWVLDRLDARDRRSVRAARGRIASTREQLQKTARHAGAPACGAV